MPPSHAGSRGLRSRRRSCSREPGCWPARPRASSRSTRAENRSSSSPRQRSPSFSSDAARIDLRALRHEWSVPGRLLGIGLPLTIVAGFVASLAVLGSLAWPEALLLAVILAPTDAALGQAV